MSPTDGLIWLSGLQVYLERLILINNAEHDLWHGCLAPHQQWGCCVWPTQGRQGRQDAAIPASAIPVDLQAAQWRLSSNDVICIAYYQRTDAPQALAMKLTGYQGIGWLYTDKIIFHVTLNHKSGAELNCDLQQPSLVFYWRIWFGQLLKLWAKTRNTQKIDFLC